MASLSKVLKTFNLLQLWNVLHRYPVNEHQGLLPHLTDDLLCHVQTWKILITFFDSQSQLSTWILFIESSFVVYFLPHFF